MKIAVFGLGYVGCTALACLASQGHEVVGFDVNAGKVDQINSGRSPITETGVDKMIADAHAANKVKAFTEIGPHLRGCDLAIVCVGTPTGADGSHNMSYVVQVTRDIAQAVALEPAMKISVSYRSTMRPGSIEQIIDPIFENFLGPESARVELVYNPEFLREASAVSDYFNPPKIVIGTRDGKESRVMRELHEGLEAPVFVVSFRQAELTKFIDNTWHAVKVSFANEIGRVCELQGISADIAHQIFVSDTKLNVSPYYLRPGGPFGGSCLPKDVRALQHLATDLNAGTHLIDSVLRSNESHKAYCYQKVRAHLEPGSKVLLVGLAFKAGTDDLRESPAVDLARKLLEGGYTLKIYDPGLSPEALVGQNLGYTYSYLPTIDTLLVTRGEAESGDFDLVVATNRTVDDLRLKGGRVIDISRAA